MIYVCKVNLIDFKKNHEEELRKRIVEKKNFTKDNLYQPEYFFLRKYEFFGEEN